MTTLFRICALLSVLAGLMLLDPVASRGDEETCLSCHEQKNAGASVHQALSMGCAACHPAVDASEVPHRFTNKYRQGLAMKVKDLCFSCHERATFMKGNVHGAILLGCTSCHDPHASAHARLLKENVPALCLGCHEDRLAPRGQGHELAGNEACSQCHDPHTSDAPKLMISSSPQRTADKTALANHRASERTALTQ